MRFASDLDDPALLNAIKLSFAFAVAGGTIDHECLPYQNEAMSTIATASLVNAVRQATLIYPSNVTAIIWYGDPRNVAFKSYDKGTAFSNGVSRFRASAMLKWRELVLTISNRYMPAQPVNPTTPSQIKSPPIVTMAIRTAPVVIMLRFTLPTHRDTTTQPRPLPTKNSRSVRPRV